jgi:microsomal dipeptidase-like Zn-dependent dipeptidase
MRSLLATSLLLVMASSTIADAQAPLWGPFRAEDCAANGRRRISSTFLNPLAAADAIAACRRATRNVMGRIVTADCANVAGRWGLLTEVRGYWSISDSSCLAVPPPPPQRNGSEELASSAPLEGFADLHVHQMAHLAMGGSIVWGGAFGPIETALGPIPDEFKHGHEAVEAAVNNRIAQVLFKGALKKFWHPEGGSPAFESWPRASIWTHQQVYEDWLFRAYQGGLRLMVMLAQNSEDMFGRGENSLPWPLKSWQFQKAKAPGRSGNDMESLEWQIREAYRMQDHVDAKYGGKGRGWYRIVRDPVEAGRVLSEGKLAVILGTELQHLFNCDLDRPQCDHGTITDGLDRLEAMGVNYVFPIHHKENQFGGPAMFQPLNTSISEHCLDLEHECSTVGLKPLGEFLVKELMARGMLIDTEHLSRRSFNQVMDLVERERYPVLASHVIPRDLQLAGAQTERAKTSEDLLRIFRSGGMVAPILGVSGAEYDGARRGMAILCDDPRNQGGPEHWMNAYASLRDLAASAGAGSIAFGSDWNGFAGWPGPRFDVADQCIARKAINGGAFDKGERVQYPIALPSLLKPAAVGGTASLPEYEWPIGVRRWNYNTAGAAHVGMLPDFVESLRVLGVSLKDLEPVYRSARAVIDLWATARDRQVGGKRDSLRWLPDRPFDILEFEHWPAERGVSAVNEALPICQTEAGNALGFIQQGACKIVARVGTAPASTLPHGEAISIYHSGKCLDVESRSRRLVQNTCAPSPTQRWVVQGAAAAATLRSGNDCIAIDPRSPGRPILASCTDQDSQKWSAIRSGNTLRLRNVVSGMCLEVTDGSRKSNAAARQAACTGASNQQWTIESTLTASSFKRLYQAELGGYAWQRSSTASYPTPVTLANSHICRSADATHWLGLVTASQCIGTTYTGVAASTAAFEGLYERQPSSATLRFSKRRL